jgi:origin recognition complex subunit 3
MAENENTNASFEEDDHRVFHIIQPPFRITIDANSAQQTAFLFNGPATATAAAENLNTKQTTARPAKRRKVARPPGADAPKPQQQQTTPTTTAGPPFPALFNGAEGPEAVRLRKQLFETAWPVLEGRIQVSEPEPGGLV